MNPGARGLRLAIAGGRIVAVGSDEEVLPLAARDLGGRSRRADRDPGFIDSHGTIGDREPASRPMRRSDGAGGRLTA
jgi:hypothetical protein